MNRLGEERIRRFKRVLKRTREGSRFDTMDSFVQHGDTSVRTHCLHVAQTAYFIAWRFGVKVDEDSLIRGALLHDYFLYDWHEKSWANAIHGYTHPGKALKQAEADFDLNETERDMIKHHMFPLTPFPPRTKEGWLLVLADKVCATGETIGDRLK
ncbi:MAG: HD domain-containing protein [Lachnospiraceae bacterium]|nr:HD domain-containing protein [Lachnospiraceae bacterium]